MKIVTWNCCLKLASKYASIVRLKPDVLIVQECENLPSQFFSDAEYHWVGHNDRKGLGILTFGEKAKIDMSFNDKLDYFLPLNLSSGQKILGVWSFTHRAGKRFGEGHKGHVSDALDYYQDWLNDSDSAIICGDFNNSVIWDRGSKPSNFSSTHQKLETLGFYSAYHKLRGESFGQESEDSLYHTKNQAKPYHIDYLYLKNIKAQNLEVGKYEDWIALSDHMPLSLDCSPDIPN
jgi:exodeoxyribonuclease-3